MVKLNFPPLEFSSEALQKRDLFAALTIGIVLALVSALWFLLDHHIPNQDEAGHILNSLRFQELFLTPRPWKGHWWIELFSVNTFYPPLVYIVSALLKCVLGAARWVDVLVACLFTFLLSSSSLLTMRLAGLGFVGSCIAPVIISLYPAVAALNHSYMLDYPLLSMVSVGLFVLYLWRQMPSLKRALLAGFILGLCCLTKQIAAIYLAGAGAFFLLETVLNGDRSKLKERLIHLILIALVTALVAAPFLLYSYKSTAELANNVKNELSSTRVERSFLGNLTYYITDAAPNLMSPFLFSVFIVSLALAGKEAHRRLLPLWTALILGVLAMSTLTSFPLSTRYLIPGLCLPACISAVSIDRLLSSGQLFKRAVVGLVLSVALIQYLSFNFCPYPIASKTLAELAVFMNNRTPDQLSSEEFHRSPLPRQEWGYDWALDKVEAKDRDLPVYLNVMANSYEVNAHSFELVARERKSSVRPTTSRIHTVAGDEIEFDREKIMYYHWYLIKTGDLGWPLRDDRSRLNQAKLVDFLNNSGCYSKEGNMDLPDGSKLFLYRQSNQ